jgi:hypothetical protein
MLEEFYVDNFKSLVEFTFRPQEDEPVSGDMLCVKIATP